MTGTYTDRTFQIGVQSGDNVTINIGGASSRQLGGLADINLLSQAGAEQGVKVADQALQQIGAIANGLLAAINNLAVTQINLQAAQSQISDTYFAAESMTLAKMKVLTQAQCFAAAQTGK